ncbi:MAG: hypothetical protein GC204_03120 [Chloroflexi bacterium]|nr:hypothetical protein [Chloroflexota bacterium]
MDEFAAPSGTWTQIIYTLPNLKPPHPQHLPRGEVTFSELTGPYAVGRIDYIWGDDSRDETNTPEAGDPRIVRVWIWYPVVPNADSEIAPFAACRGRRRGTEKDHMQVLSARHYCRMSITAQPD